MLKAVLDSIAQTRRWPAFAASAKQRLTDTPPERRYGRKGPDSDPVARLESLLHRVSFGLTIADRKSSRDTAESD